MPPKRNYQKEMEKVLARLEGRKTLLLHACCAPCSSYVLSYLTEFFDIVLDFYNPNIAPESEYAYRRAELLRLIGEMPHAGAITVLESDYDERVFYDAVRGLEAEPEGGARCAVCFRLRLEHAAREAARIGADYFTTTLTISPHKNADLLNALGQEIAAAHGLTYLCSDFKKRNGFKESIALSEQYDLYRQDYCGCAYSKAEREAQKREMEQAQNAE